MLIVVNLTLGFWLLEFISVFVMLLLLLLDAQVKGTRVWFALLLLEKTGCASSGYKFDSCGILKETGEKLLVFNSFFDSGLNFSGWWW